MPPLRGSGFTDLMADAARAARLEAVPSARGDQFASVQRPSRLRLSRLLQSRRLPHQREEFDRGHHHPGRDEDQEPDDFRSRARDAGSYPDANGHVTGVTYMKDGRNIFSPPRWCCSRPTPTKTRGCCCFRSRKRIRTGLSNNHGQVGRHYFGHSGRAASARCFRSTSTSGTERPRKPPRSTIGPTTTTITPASASSAGRVCTPHTEMHPIEAAGHEHVRPRARRGARNGRPSSARTPRAGRRRICRPRPFPTSTRFSISTPR